MYRYDNYISIYFFYVCLVMNNDYKIVNKGIKIKGGNLMTIKKIERKKRKKKGAVSFNKNKL